MTSQTPPYPYFNGITYNSSFFTSSSSSGTVSGSLYYPTAQGAEYFPYGLSSVGITNAGTISTGVLSSGLISSTNNIQAVGNITSTTGSITGVSLGNTAGTGGISSTGAITGISFDTTTPSTTFNFLTSQLVGINMGTSLPSGQTIQIGPMGSTAGVSVRCSNVDFTNNSINNATSASGDLNIATNQISGILNLGANAFRTGNINKGTGGLGGVISIGSTGAGLNSLVCKGSTGSSFSIIGPILSGNITSTGFISGAGITGTSLSLGTGAISTVGNITSTGDIQATTGKIKTTTLDAVADTIAGTTALKIGSNILLGDIDIGNAQTTGDIKIGLSDTSGATITVGTSSTATTINGTLTTSLGKIAGGYLTGAGLPATIPNTINMDFIFIINTATVSSTLTLPTIVSGQIIRIRNLTGYTHTIQSAGLANNIWPINTAAFATSCTIGPFSSIVIQADSATWYQIGTTDILALSQPLTLPTTSITPSSLQLGYYATGGVGFTTVSYFSAFPSGTALGSISSLPIGRYIFLLSYSADTFTNIGTYFQFNTNMTNGSCDAMFGISLGQSASTGGKTSGSTNGLVTITATSGTIALVGRTEATGTSVNVYVTMRLYRLA